MKTFYFNQEGEYSTQRDLVKGIIVFQCKTKDASTARYDFRKFVKISSGEIVVKPKEDKVLTDTKIIELTKGLSKDTRWIEKCKTITLDEAVSILKMQGFPLKRLKK